MIALTVWKRALFALALLLVFLGGALSGFERVALNPAVYDRIQAELDVYASVGLSPEAQSRVNRVLAGYLRGERGSIDVEESLFGVYGQVFNENERAHMVDVQALFLLERRVRTACLAAGCLLTVLLAAFHRRRIGRAALSGLLGFGLTLAVLAAALWALWSAVGFDRLFIAFHHLLFTNELWLMDPATDAMIRMLPAGFFLRIAALSGRSALVFGLASVAAAVALWLLAGLITTRSGRKQTP